MNDQPSNVANMVPGPPVGSFVKISHRGAIVWVEVGAVRCDYALFSGFIRFSSDTRKCAAGGHIIGRWQDIIGWLSRADALQLRLEAHGGPEKDMNGWPTERPEPRAHLMRLDGAVGPMEFAAGMRRINERYARQPKIRRRLAVANLCEVLRSLGYHEGIGAFLEAEGDA